MHIRDKGLQHKISFYNETNHLFIKMGTDGQTYTTQIDEQTDGQIDRQTDGQTDGRTDRRTDKQTDGRTDGGVASPCKLCPACCSSR